MKVPETSIGRVLVVGGVGIDDAVYLPGPLRPGMWAQAQAEHRSPGGSGATVAAAVASADLHVALAGAVGTDSDGDWLHTAVIDAGVHPHLTHVTGPSPRSLVIVGADAERTIVGLTPDLLSQAADALPDADRPKEHDLLVIPAWRPLFYGLLADAHRVGARTVVGLRAAADTTLHADIAVGSERELGGVDPRTVLDRIPVVVVTRGPAGASAYHASGRVDVAPVAVHAVDSTGAGDAFLAGITVSFANHATIDGMLALAATWGAAAAGRLGTPAPSFDEVTRRRGADL